MIILGAPFLPAIALLLVAGLVPVIYSFLHYKSLERRGALEQNGSETKKAPDPFV
jgi:hypothetical protein